MWPWCDLIAIKRLDNRKEVAKVSERFYWGRNKVPELLQNQMSLELWACIKDWPRLIWSLRFCWAPRDLKVVLFSSPTGCWLCNDWFHPGKGGDSLKPSDDLSVTDQRWGSDRSALHLRLVVIWWQSGFQACADHLLIALQKSPICLCIHHLSHILA